ncbi:MAG: response regulator transcription factor [Betaproteobacteria bacterium]|nr:response regulator transcription factor [Betaproteobacteria bacterium]
MKILGIDPDSRLGSILERHAFAAGADLRMLPARRVGEALALLECDRDICCCLLDARVATQDQYALPQMLSRRFAALPVLVVVDQPDAETFRAWLARGVRGIVSGAMPAEELLRALRAVVAGGLFLPPGGLDGSFLAPALERIRLAQPELTPRQREVLTLLAEGHATRDICLRLGLTEGTVKNHLGAIFRQLRVRNRLQAVLAARRCLGSAPATTPAKL